MSDSETPFVSQITYDPPSESSHLSKNWKILSVSFVASMIQSYNFDILGMFANEIGQSLFPPNLSKTVDEILVYAVFWTSFAARPFGGALFGYFGDLYGRGRAFQVTLTVMAISTFLIGCIPNFDTFSYASPVLLLLCVIAQGLSKGGQVGALFVYIYETAPTESRAFWMSLMVISSTGAFSCTFIKLIIDEVLSEEELLSYGWRIAFWIGIVLWPIACYSKYALQRTSIFRQIERDLDRVRDHHSDYESDHDVDNDDDDDDGIGIGNQRDNYNDRNPFVVSFGEHGMKTLTFIGASALNQITPYLFYIFLPLYLSSDWMHGWIDDASYQNQGYLVIVTIVVVMVSGIATDKYGPFRLLVISAISTLIGAPLVFYGYTMTSEVWQDVLLSMVMVIILNVTSGAIFFWYIDVLLIDPRTRTRIFGVAYNIGAVLFAGTAPFLGVEFIEMGGIQIGAVLIGGWTSLLALTSLIWYYYAEKIGKPQWIDHVSLEHEVDSQMAEEREMLTAPDVSDEEL